MLVLADLPITKAAIHEISVHSQSISLMQQQLNALDSGYLSWREEVREGQSIDGIFLSNLMMKGMSLIIQPNGTQRYIYVCRNLEILRQQLQYMQRTLILSFMFHN